MSTLAIFLSGMTTMGFVVAAVFFCRFWRHTNDLLFFTFGTAFLLLALNQSVIALSGKELFFAYLLRAMAFGTLIVGIAAKNFRSRQTNRAP